MEARVGDSQASWAPATPGKQYRDPICDHEQEKQKTQPNSYVPVRGNESQVTLVLNETGFQGSDSQSSLTNSAGATAGLSGLAEAAVGIGSFSMECVDKNMPFSDLLALANAASVKAASGSNSYVGSMSVTQFEDKEAKQVTEKTNQARKELGNNMNGVVQQIEQSSEGRSSEIVLEKNNSVLGVNESLGKGTPTPQKPRRKRYMPKVVKEGQTKRTPNVKTPKPVNPNDTPKPKRKYVRKKATVDPPNTPYVDLTQTDDDTPSINLTNINSNIYPDTPSVDLASSKLKPVGRPQRSCRRSLNFESFQEVEETSSCSHASELHWKSQSFYTCMQPTMPLGHGLGKSVEKDQVDQIGDVQSGGTRGKCRIVFSDLTHDKESNFRQMIDLNSTPASRSPNDSNCSISTPVSKGEQARGMKRGHLSATGDLYSTDVYSTNLIGAHQNSVKAYRAMFPADQYSNGGIPDMNFPTIHKKKRTEKCQNSIEQTTEYSTKVNWGHALTSENNCLPFAIQGNRPLGTGSMLDTDNKETRKKRSKASTRGRSLASLIEIVESIQSTRFGIRKEVGTSHQAYSHAAITTKKRTKRYTRASGVAFSVDALVERLWSLNINAKSKEVAISRRYNRARYEEQKALVVYQRDGTLVTTKKRKSRPRVKLDDETTRVWKLLLQDINSEGINGTDEEKEKWWEEERRIFHGRANSFINCMHLIQGDRTFSRWKGSVVDSVVGVFLTQNVSDHLSSSAYMSLAAKYPLFLKSNEDPLSKEVVTVPVDDEEASVLSLDDTIQWHGIKSKQPTLDTEPRKIQDAECNEDRETINSNESSVSSMGCFMPDITSFVGGTTSFVELLRMAQETQYNGEVAMLSGIYREEKELFCSEESGSSKEIASHTDSQHYSLQTESDILCQPQTASQDLKNEVSSSDQETIYQVGKVNMERNPGTLDVTGSTGVSDIPTKSGQETSLKNNGTNPDGKRNNAKKGTTGKGRKAPVDWDSLRKLAQANGERVRTPDTMDSVDWEAVRVADVKEVAHTIRERGMNNMLAERIKDFLNRLVSDHESIDLEWLRDVQPDKAKEYLLSIRGLGLKSVECVRLLTLHHIAFPVDTNVGRIAVRLGWVPLQPLPESLQLHLLELYPVLESIQKYLWPRLCKLDQRTLYELHYQMITFGKVFCTKSKPNCNACPLRGECRHFASAFASARLALPGPEERSTVTSEDNAVIQYPVGNLNRLQLPVSQARSDQLVEAHMPTRNCEPIVEEPASPEPIVEVPATPEPERAEALEQDIEDFYDEDPDEIPTIKLNMHEFTQTLQEYLQRNMVLQEGDVSRALVALTPEAASIPAVKLKNQNRLRTEHQVYELPDTHPLLDGLDGREPDDPCSYLLAIWTPGETADSIQPPAGPCSNKESGGLCSDDTCFACSSTREAQSQTVRGTILIPCRTAMRGSFPLNGTYFQVNEVFADHASSLKPLEIPRYLLWNLPRRTVYFGTSVTSIFRDMATKDIQLCFWKGFVCVRGFDRENRAPRPLMARLHFPVSKLSKGKEKKETE